MSRRDRRLRHRRRGQSIAEYAVLATAVIGALAMMSLYLKHAVAGRWRGAADSIGEPYDPKQTTSPGMTTTITSTATTTSTLLKDQTLKGGVKADVMESKTVIADDTTTRTGSETIGSGGSIWD